MRTLCFRLLILLALVTVSLRGFTQDSIPQIDEWKEIFQLRNKFYEGQLGSQYLMGLFDGQFVGPNNQTDFGLRTYTTAFDYLILGNNLLSVLINLGYTAENIKFIEAGKVPNTVPYELGCISFYSIADDKRWVDSVFSTKLGKMVAVDKPYYAKDSRLKIDSTNVEVKLCGVQTRIKVGKEIISDTLIIKPINGSGSWKDANNYDMIYEWMEVIFKATMDSFDVQKRPFSKHTPEDIKQCILQRFDTKKYLEATHRVEKELEYKISDPIGYEVFDLLHQPNGKIFRVKNYEIFRFFNDVYYRDYSSTPSKRNPVWYNAYQYDKDTERNAKGMIEFIRLSYGAGKYMMPTVIPGDLAAFTQFEGVVMYSSGTDRMSHSNKDDIWINTINGRMVDRNFFEYPAEQGILPLNDDGTVDRIYKIYSWKDRKLYWAYIYCGKHAGVRGGKPGKSFVDQVDNFRTQYNARDYWHFVDDVDYATDVKNRMPAFVQELQNYVNRVEGVSGKTIPSIKYSFKKPGDKKNEEITIVKTLRFNTDYTATLDPEGLIIPWEIIEIVDDRLVKTKHIKLDVLNEEIYLEDLEEYLLANDLAGSDVQKFNREYKKGQKNIEPVADTVESTTVYYNKQVFDLANTDDVKTLLDIILQDISSLEYQIPEQTSSIEWQRKRKVETLEAKLELMEEEGKTNTEDYANATKDYDLQKDLLQKMESKLTFLETSKEQLLELKFLYRDAYISNLQNNLGNIREKKSFINDQITKLIKERQTLEQEGKAGTPEYDLIVQSLKNKDSELLEIQEKENQLLQMIADQQNTNGQ